MPKALEKAGIAISDVDYFDLMKHLLLLVWLILKF
jgi:hypothetical protein